MLSCYNCSRGRPAERGFNCGFRFLPGLVSVLLLIYFGLVKVLYKVETGVDVTSRRTRARQAGPVAEMRAEMGDRDMTGLMLEVRARRGSEVVWRKIDRATH